jgi:hypothetical protein
MTEKGWLRDPAGVHEFRYYDGARWTDLVSDHGISKVDPVPAGSRQARAWWIAGAAIGAVVLLLAAVVAVVLVRRSDGRPVNAARTSSSQPTPSSAPAPTPTGLPETGPAIGPGGGEPSSPPPASGRQALRVVPTVIVVGPAFAAGDKTFTMSFDGWPFAFRVPGTWGCMRGTVALSNAMAWVCVDEAHPSAQQRLNIMVRPCPTTCTPAEQKSMSTAWFDAAGRRPVVRDATTSYLQTPSDPTGKYTLDMSHFFVGPAGGPLHWQVGAFVESPPATKGTVQKIINEVRSQSGR